MQVDGFRGNGKTDGHTFDISKGPAVNGGTDTENFNPLE